MCNNKELIEDLEAGLQAYNDGAVFLTPSTVKKMKAQLRALKKKESANV